jgi:hypothetical protein
MRENRKVNSKNYDKPWTKSKNPVIPSVIHHRQNPLESTNKDTLKHYLTLDQIGCSRRISLLISKQVYEIVA